MTSIVGVRCKDGVVIGADSSATFGDGGYKRTIEQQTDKKIEIIGGKMIVAGTGAIGMAQRFNTVAASAAQEKAFKEGTALSCAKMLSRKGIEDFAITHASKLDYGALVAYVAQGEPVLCELPLGALNPALLSAGMPQAFQPELKSRP